MGGGQFYIYLYALLCVALGFLAAIGGGLYWWGRRAERLKREARRASREEEAP